MGRQDNSGVKKQLADGSKRTFRAGEIILEQGDTGEIAYIIEDGEVEIFYKRPDGRIQAIGTRGPGAIVGEMGLFDEGPRTATVRALKDCKLLEITREDFSQHLEETDPVVRMIARVMLIRFRDLLTRSEILRETGSSTPPEFLERSSMHESDVVSSVKIANQFKSALENGVLQLHYQPIVNLASGRVDGCEALMRWEDPILGVMNPSIFIPIAEKSLLIAEATKWVAREACEAAVRIGEAIGRDDFYISINLSNLSDPATLDWLTEALGKSGASPSQLMLEITERILIREPEKAKQTLQQCTDAGMKVAIDDFGTGYSSLSYLHYFPISTLKMDQSFIRGVGEAQRSFELVKSIVGLSRGLKLRSVAEGVESAREKELLHEMGCDAAQGYYFAKAMPEPTLIDFLARPSTKN